MNKTESEKWISVKDKLPEYSDNYLVFVSDGWIDVGVYHSDKKAWSMCDADGFYWTGEKNVEVTHWKPLPKEPSSEDNNEAEVSYQDVIKELWNCRNELCLRCGKYEKAYLGACNDCRYSNENMSKYKRERGGAKE